jgi:processive 1,2-diacylglycerol beta-glucosyltransferase
VIRLYDNDNESEIGQLSEAQLDFLQEQLVEDAIDSYTFDLSQASLDSLEMNGGEADLVAMLRKAIGTRNSMEVRYELD